LPLVPGRKSDAHSSRLPKIVWSYWNGDVSPFVLACIGNIRRFVSSTAGGQWIVVTDAEIDPFLSTYGRHVLHSFPELSAQHRADLIRLLLLHEHGGIWTDATNIFTENLDWVDEVWAASDPDLLYSIFCITFLCSSDRYSMFLCP
jgi:mannosyltransferase OCH1-like enzyme